MKLKEYLANIDMTLKDFSEIIDRNPCYLSSVINGYKKPGKKLVKEVKAITEGKVNLLLESLMKRKKV